ncbi:hypothetical protein CA233_05880 [Sphingomonas sp. ABOLD]|uniref:Uncharacterized protein n=1 Tax=Sphingomonas trueperi TaxID=53317 RepID=A0A7X6BD41_9SPHN|nr:MULTISPECIES: hypothetical protein [Sphingomonas]NJB97292.1 hypothetical protein [Sphingomonas trueperi]RSV34364.1 hypothetical protein CA234_21365 [Sphingomonas sp. ABOLE]RSV50603.1 hypothetical protein CA233_05880 [Sphingomonas sp. ABOLD]
MTVRVDADAIYLVGRCPAEDADTLLVALQEAPDRTVDLGAAQRLHLAVAQVLLAARPPVCGVPSSDFLARYLLNLLQ